MGRVRKRVGTVIAWIAMSHAPFVAAQAAQQPAHDVYVDPTAGNDANPGLTAASALRSLEAARDRVRRMRATEPAQTNDIVIHLAAGEYPLERTLVLGVEDSGQGANKLIWRGPVVGKATLSGGIRLGGWTLHDPQKDIWRCAIPGEQAVKSRQLFLNGRRALRAYADALSWNYRVGNDGIITNDPRLSAFTNIGDVELVFKEIWTNPRCGIESVSSRADGTYLLKMKEPGFTNCRKKGMTRINTPWRVENAYELIDEPGEWYSNTRDVFYKPYPWEDMSRSEAVMPVLEQLVRLEGRSANERVENIRFENVSFQYTTWTRPSTEHGLPDAQNCVMREQRSGVGKLEFVPHAAALVIEQARGIELDGCHFERLGGLGVLMLAGSRENTVRGCSFLDISGTGLQAGDYTPMDGEDLPGGGPNSLVENTVEDCYFNRCGVEYRSSTAIAMAYPVQARISHNEILNMPYSGIHIGWGWNTVKQTATAGNLIDANFIRNVMLEQADGGAIYTLGPSRSDGDPNVIRNNYARQIRLGQAWYLDEGSNAYEVVDNVAEQISDAVLKVNTLDGRSRARGLYADRDRIIIRKGVRLDEQEPIRRIDRDTQANLQAQAIRAAAGIRPPRQSARVRVRDRMIYEAEEAQLTGGARATVTWKPGKGSNWLGMGYVEGIEKPSAAIQFEIEAPAGPGTYSCQLRYQLPDTDNTQLMLTTSSGQSQIVQLHPTGDTAWNSAEFRLNLHGGDEWVRLERSGDTAHASVLLDRLIIMPPG
jgi:hypothetical protein